MGLTWDQLADLRAKGQRPALLVLANSRVGRAMWECLPVLKPEASRLPLLSGLDLILMDGCGPAREISRSLREAGIRTGRFLTWCERDKTLAKLYGTCTCRT